MNRLIKKTIAILLTVCFVLSITAATVSARAETPNDENMGNSKCYYPDPNRNVVPINSVYHGKTYEQWSEKWWQWAASIPAPINPILAPTGFYDASIGQSGNVWFLAGTDNKQRIERTVKIPAGKSIFFPIVNVLFFNDDDYTEDVMRDTTKAIIDDTKVLEVTVDGKPLKNLENFRKGSDLFVVKTPKNGDFIYPVLKKQKYYQSVSDGYWIMLKPLSKGVHTIRIHGKVENTKYQVFNEVGVKYIITVT
jgi:hypothetical protein